MSGPGSLSIGAYNLWLKVKAIFPDAVFTSGARTAAQNAGIPGASSSSQHLTGDAFDFTVPGLDPASVQRTLANSLQMPFGQSIAEYGSGMGPRNHLSTGSKMELLTGVNGVYSPTQYSGLDFSGQDPIGDALRKYVPEDWQKYLGQTVGPTLSAPGNYIDNAIKGATDAVIPDVNSWFERIAVAVFALIFIAAALFAFKGGDVIRMASKA